jgi:signal transduction histidine kinase
MEVMAEYRALRASVIRLWRESGPDPDLDDLDDLTRFNESIDQSAAEAVRSYIARVDRSRQMFLAILGHDLRNPLNSMLMSAELLSHETAQVGVDPSETAAQIKTSAAAMGRMIGDLLDFTGAALGGAMPLKPARSIVCAARWSTRCAPRIRRARCATTRAAISPGSGTPADCASCSRT